MRLLRISFTGIGTAVACIALFLAVAVATASAAEPPCTSSVMYTVAHEDDTLLFQSPALVQDIESNRCVLTVFLTAGDAGKPQAYWEEREEGAEAAYAQMAGVADAWTAGSISPNGHVIHTETLAGRPGVSLAFMRLPDGGTDGEGFPLYGSQSLWKLWNEGHGEDPAIGSIEAVDDSTSYSYDDLIETLATTMEAFQPRQILTQDFSENFLEGDHPDHTAAAYFTRAGQEEYGGPDRLQGYKGYQSSSQPQNVFGELLGAKSFAFYTYGAHDSEACVDEVACAPTAYAAWLKRQYVTGTETLGVVANAGYAQTTTPSAPVALDGSQSSDQSGNALSYQWTQTRGPTVSLSGAKTEAPTFLTPPHPTLLTFSLTVKDGATVSEPDFVNVRVPSSDPTPTAVAGPAQAVSSGATVNLDGSASYDPNSEPLQYAWIQTAGPALTISGSSTATPSFVAPTGPVSVTLSLVVSNGEETSAPSTVTINVHGVLSAPVFTGPSIRYGLVGRALNVPIDAAGTPPPTLSLSGAPPAGLRFAAAGPGGAILSGTPTEPRTTRLTAVAENLAGRASQTLTLVVDPQPKLSKARVQLLVGKRSRQTVRVLASHTSSIRCTGRLPQGARCLVKADRTVLVEGSGRVRKTGTYRLVVHVSGPAGTVLRQLVVRVRPAS